MQGLPAMVHSDGIRKSTQVKFGGYDHNLGAGDGALWDMENLTGDEYPLLASRPLRRKLREMEEPGGITAHNGLYWVDGTGFYAGGERKGTVTAGRKTFAFLGNTLLIFPDKLFYRTDTEEFGPMEAPWVGQAAFQDGTYNGEAAKANTIRTTGEPFHFSVGDGVTISGCGLAENNKTAVVQEISEDGRELRFLENCFSSTAWTGVVTIKRAAPDMDFLCENENRLWGCKGSTIYASALGNPLNWNNFSGVATDSYAVDVGSPGDFTGCCSYLGYPIFFKEDHIYKVYGSKPSNFQVMASASLGVAKGSERSLAVAGERLFYLSRAGVMSYGGGMPENISHAFGTVKYKNGAGGAGGVKYFLSMEDENGAWSLFVYDTRTGLWHREDGTRVLDFAWDGRLHMLEAEGGLWLFGDSEEGEPEEELASFAEFGDFVESSPDKKGYSKLQMRVELEAGAELTVLLKFDSEEEWQQVAVLKAEKKRSFVMPVIPRRCDHWRLRLEGKGAWKLYSMSREFYQGSDV